jgi:hypothetical protein
MEDEMIIRILKRKREHEWAESDQRPHFFKELNESPRRH